MTCSLCDALTSEVFATDLWRVAVNVNQDKLGKCMIALRRHDEDIANLTDPELLDLWSLIRRTKAALTTLFHPDHFNYMFLMNQDAHVHLHVVPRYHSPRTFAAIEFADDGTLDGFQRRLPTPIHDALIAALTATLRSDADPKPKAPPLPALGEGAGG